MCQKAKPARMLLSLLMSPFLKNIFLMYDTFLYTLPHFCRWHTVNKVTKFPSVQINR